MLVPRAAVSGSAGTSQNPCLEAAPIQDKPFCTSLAEPLCQQMRKHTSMSRFEAFQGIHKLKVQPFGWLSMMESSWQPSDGPPSYRVRLFSWQTPATAPDCSEFHLLIGSHFVSVAMSIWRRTKTKAPKIVSLECTTFCRSRESGRGVRAGEVAPQELLPLSIPRVASKPLGGASIELLSAPQLYPRMYSGDIGRP